MEKTDIKKVAGGLIAGLVVGAAGFGVSSEPVTVTEIINETIVINETVEIEVEVPVEVIREVNVTDARLGDVVQHIFDRDGDVEYIVDEYDADEVDQIADAFLFVHEMVKEGSDHIKKEIADELDRENVSGTVLDEDDVERIRVDDNLDEVGLEDFDAEDKEIDITYNVRFEHDDEDFTAEVTIEIRDGKVDDMIINQVNKV